jgi:hypothetical protein
MEKNILIFILLMYAKYPEENIKDIFWYALNPISGNCLSCDVVGDCQKVHINILKYRNINYGTLL